MELRKLSIFWLGLLLLLSAACSSTPAADTLNPIATDRTVPTNTPAGRTVRIGLHGRNDFHFHELDYLIIRRARIETLKMISITEPYVFDRIKQENPDIEFIVRLYDPRLYTERVPTPEEFADRMIPVMQNLQPYVIKFEILNEPNHPSGFEGWGIEEAEAKNFNDWFLKVYDLLKEAHPWAELGYPGLAPVSLDNNKAWLEINRDAVNRADWLGVHCYWHSLSEQENTIYHPEGGMCFKYYHEMFPDKPIEITEFDNDTIYRGLPLPSSETVAQEHVTYYQAIFEYPYIRSASSFLLSSPDRNWDYFAWRTEDGEIKPVVTEVGHMPRPPLEEAQQ